MPKILHLTEPNFDYNTLNVNSVLLYSIDQNLTSDQYHTSLGDLSSNDIIFLSNQFDEINFVSDGFDLKSDIFKETIILLNFLSHRKKITNFKIAEKINFATLTTHNNLEDKKFASFTSLIEVFVASYPSLKLSLFSFTLLKII